MPTGTCLRNVCTHISEKKFQTLVTVPVGIPEGHNIHFHLNILETIAHIFFFGLTEKNVLILLVFLKNWILDDFFQITVGLTVDS